LTLFEDAHSKTTYRRRYPNRYQRTLLENLQLVENNFVNRAAILLFHYKPENFITGAYVKKYTINERTARRDVIGLVEKGILIRQGDKKSTKYHYR